MSVMLIGFFGNDDDVTKVESWEAAVLPNRKVLVSSESEYLKSDIENTIKVRSELYTKHTGEAHMPVKELFSEVLSSWTTMSSYAEEMEDSDAKKIMKEAGIS